MTIDEAPEAIGHRVTYTSGHDTTEHGEIIRVNDAYAFVRYDGDRHPKATTPDMLTDDRCD